MQPFLDLLPNFGVTQWAGLGAFLLSAYAMRGSIGNLLSKVKLPSWGKGAPDRKAAIDALMVAHDYCEGCAEGQAAIQAAIAHVLKHSHNGAHA